MQNNGTVAWPKTALLKFSNGDKILRQLEYPIGHEVLPTQHVQIEVMLEAPKVTKDTKFECFMNLYEKPGALKEFG